MEVLFSFGTSEQYPFQRGYIIINAANRYDAVQEYRKRYPDRTPGVINCADIYDNYYTVKEFKENGNLGAGCHLYIDLTREKEIAEMERRIQNGENDPNLTPYHSMYEHPAATVIGKIDYLAYDGRTRESSEYNDMEQFVSDCNDATDYGEPIRIMVYRDKDGTHIPIDWVYKLDPPPKGFDVVDSPYLQAAKTNAEISGNEAQENTTPKHNTVVVNLFAGPGAGKTTCAWEIAAELKKAGLVVEYVSEVAKEYVWNGDMSILDGSLEHQQQLYEQQNQRVQRLMGKVDAIVTDSPILLNLLYLKEKNPDFEQTVISQFKEQRNFNLFVNRGKRFEKEGRIHDLKQSVELDNAVISLLRDNKLFYGTYTYSEMKQCVKNIQTTVNKARLPANHPPKQHRSAPGLPEPQNPADPHHKPKRHNVPVR